MSKTNYDAFREAKELTQPVKDDFELGKKKFLNNAATIISLVSIYLMAVLYAYDKGFYDEYNIITNYYDIDLRRFIPLLVQVIGLYVFISYYFGSLKYEQIHKERTFKYYRILWGSIIMEIILMQHNNHIMNLIVSFAISTLVELILCWTNRTIKEEKLTKSSYKIKLEDNIADNFIFFMIRKPILIILIVIIIISPMWGKYTAHNRTEYEIITIDNKEYAIISKVGDNAYIENVDINKKSAVIYTDEYMKISALDIAIQKMNFDEVKIK